MNIFIESTKVEGLIQQQGGRITATFKANTIFGTSRLKARYLIKPSSQPFVFANGTKQEGLEGTDKKGLAVRGEPAQSFTKVLDIRRQGSGTEMARLDIELEVDEVNDKGDRIDGPEKAGFHPRVELAAAAFEMEELVVVAGPTLGQALRQKRLELGMTQREMANHLNIGSRSVISRVERDLGCSDANRAKIEKFL